MKTNGTFGAMNAGLLAIAVSGSMPLMAADSDGCWSGRHSGGSCLEYRTYEKANKTYFKLTNVCTDRLYMRWCADKSCGADSLRAGQTKKKYEYVTSARTMAKAVGSNKPSKDWVCTGKVDDWHD